jgi:hypothetical protein
VALVRERTIPTERPLLLAKLVPTFADRGCHVVSETDLYCRIVRFLDRLQHFLDNWLTDRGKVVSLTVQANLEATGIILVLIPVRG